MSIQYRWFKRYQLHLCTTTEGIILSHVMATANRHDAAVTPELLSSLQGWDIEFAFGDATYDSEQIRQTAEQVDIFLVSLINRHNNDDEKMPMAV
jgi:IS5 family transposase